LLAPRLLEVVQSIEARSLVWTPLPRINYIEKGGLSQQKEYKDRKKPHVI